MEHYGGNNIEILLEETMQSPGTTITIALTLAFYIFLWYKKITFNVVAISYESIVDRGEWYRIVSGSLAHFSIIHLAFNLSSMWSLRYVETFVGTLYFIHISCLLLVSTVIVMLVVYKYILVGIFGKHEYYQQYSVGYSAVLFGWMTIASQLSTTRVIIVLGVQIPFTLAPFSSLIFTQLLVPRASFVGHMSGIVMGYAISWGWFYWFTGWWCWSLVILCLLAAFWSIIKLVKS